jgi:flagellar basal body-associated protein FliL
MAKEVLNKDISNKTVVIVLVIVILVSIVSLGVYFNALGNAQPKVNSLGQGDVSLTIVEPPVKVEPVTDNGKVALNIVEPPKEAPTQ